MKNILILNSNKNKNPFLLDFIKDLRGKNYEFHLRSFDSEIIDEFKKNNWPAKKIFLLPKIKTKISFFRVRLFWPFLFLFNFFRVLFWKYKDKINSVLCLGMSEKIFFTRIALFFKLKVIWLDEPQICYQNFHQSFSKFYKKFYKRVFIINFLSKNKEQFARLGLDSDYLHIIRPSVKLRHDDFHQESIFNSLAKAEKVNQHRKYFTLGVVTDFKAPNQLETLLQAVKICKTIIPNIQLVVVGEGEGKKQFAWTAKKMEIDNIVWLLGWQNNLKKWLDSFNIYLMVSEQPKLFDIKLTLKAMAASLPIISFSDLGYEDFIYNNENGFLSDLRDNEILASNILKFHNNKLLLHKFGRRSQEIVWKRFNIEKQIKEFENIL